MRKERKKPTDTQPNDTHTHTIFVITNAKHTAFIKCECTNSSFVIMNELEFLLNDKYKQFLHLRLNLNTLRTIKCRTIISVHFAWFLFCIIGNHLDKQKCRKWNDTIVFCWQMSVFVLWHIQMNKKYSFEMCLLTVKQIWIEIQMSKWIHFVCVIVCRT